MGLEGSVVMNRWLCVIIVSVSTAISLLARSAGTPSGRGTNRVSCDSGSFPDADPHRIARQVDDRRNVDIRRLVNRLFHDHRLGGAREEAQQQAVVEPDPGDDDGDGNGGKPAEPAPQAPPAAALGGSLLGLLEAAFE